MGKIEAAVNEAINIANDDTHGYDQQDRWGEYGDYDCSSLMYTVWEDAGVHVKFGLPMYTGSMYNHFTRAGFADVTHLVNLATGAGLQRGDILLNTVHHTCMYIGNGQIVEAQWSENCSAYGYAGDQTGQEIWVRSYYNYPWNYVLRYTEKQETGVKGGVTYQVASQEDGWYSEVTSGITTGEDSYAGCDGAHLTAFRAKSNLGTVRYRVHCINDGWYDWRDDYNKDAYGDDFAGDGQAIIDGLQVQPIAGHNVKYRVYTAHDGWLPWVINYNDTDNGYAGWYGRPCEKVEIVVL